MQSTLHLNNWCTLSVKIHKKFFIVKINKRWENKLDGWTESSNLQVSGEYCLATSRDCILLYSLMSAQCWFKNWSLTKHVDIQSWTNYRVSADDSADGLDFLLTSRTAVAPVSRVRGAMMMITPLLIFKVSPDTHENVPGRQLRHPSSPPRHRHVDGYIHMGGGGVT